MIKFTLRSLPVVFVLCVLAACSYTPPKPGANAKDPQSAYAEARELLDGGSYESAIAHYEQLEARFPYGPHAQQAQLDTAFAHYRLQDTESTIAASDRFIRQHPNHPAVDYAYYLKGLAYQNARVDDWLPFLPKQPLSDRDARALTNAFETFKIVVTRYPTGLYADDSRKQMETLLEALATHELNAARYYLKRRAPLAAANRAQVVITKYAASQSSEEALALLVQSYSALQIKDLRDDAERILRQNYPNSRFLSKR